MGTLIHDRVAGKTVNAVLTNGKELILQLTTGEEVVIAWGLDGPVFVRQNVNILLPMPSGPIFGIGGSLN